MDDQVRKMLEKGPSSVAEAEAEWYIEQAELEFKKPAHAAFLLGVAFAGSTARHSWKKTETYADAMEAQKSPAYATSGNVTPVHAARRGGGVATPKAAQVGDEVDPSTIRQWLRDKNYEVNERGRISQALKDVYYAAMEAKTRKATERAAVRAAKPATPRGASVADRRAALRQKQAPQATATAPAVVERSDRHTRNVAAGQVAQRSVRGLGSRTRPAPVAHPEEVDF